MLFRSEALRQLELEGLVTIIPNKGAYVVGISQKDIKDIYEIRSRLEGLCAKWAAENITKEQLDELEENIFLSDFHATKGNAEQMVELDNKFHEILYTASGRLTNDKWIWAAGRRCSNIDNSWYWFYQCG